MPSKSCWLWLLSKQLPEVSQPSRQQHVLLSKRGFLTDSVGQQSPTPGAHEHQHRGASNTYFSPLPLVPSHTADSPQITSGRKMRFGWFRLEVGRKLLQGKIRNQLHCLKGTGLAKSPLTQGESKQLDGMEWWQEKQTAVTTAASLKIPAILGTERSLMLKQFVWQPMGNPSSLE